MQNWLGGDPKTGIPGSRTWTSPSKYGPYYQKTSQLRVPVNTFVFLDEREDAINWGNFYADMAGYSPRNPTQYMLADMPGTYHGNACGFSFADGHSELRRWRDARTAPPVKYQSLIFDGYTETPSPGNPDVAWLQDHSTRPK